MKYDIYEFCLNYEHFHIFIKPDHFEGDVGECRFRDMICSITGDNLHCRFRGRIDVVYIISILDKAELKIIVCIAMIE